MFHLGASVSGGVLHPALHHEINKQETTLMEIFSSRLLGNFIFVKGKFITFNIYVEEKKVLEHSIVSKKKILHLSPMM